MKRTSVIIGVLGRSRGSLLPSEVVAMVGVESRYDEKAAESRRNHVEN